MGHTFEEIIEARYKQQQRERLEISLLEIYTRMQDLMKDFDMMDMSDNDIRSAAARDIASFMESPLWELANKHLPDACVKFKQKALDVLSRGLFKDAIGGLYGHR